MNGVFHDQGGAVFNVKAYGAVGNGTNNDTQAFKDAITNASSVAGGIVYVPGGTYRITDTLVLGTVGVRIVGVGGGGFYTYPTIKWDGPTDGGLLSPVTMIKISPGAHAAGVEGLTLDGSFNGVLKAGVCVQVEGSSGGATFNPGIRFVNFQGYRRRGLVIGPDVNETSPTNPSNLQVGVTICSGLTFLGGLAGAIGVVINAQNAEWVQFSGLYFDPPTDTVAHKHHMFVLRGGVAIEDCISTRATDYAFHLEERFRIGGWNSEDRFLLRTTSIDPGGPCSVVNVMQRFHEGPSGVPQSTDATFRIAATEHTTTLEAVTVQGRIVMSPTDPVTVVAIGVRSMLFPTIFDFHGLPFNQRGIFHSVPSGDFLVRGQAPRLRTLLSDGTPNVDIRGRVDIFGGAGNPQGVVTASVGALYLRTDGGAGSTLYVKESGTGNMGWVAK